MSLRDNLLEKYGVGKTSRAETTTSGGAGNDARSKLLQKYQLEKDEKEEKKDKVTDFFKDLKIDPNLKPEEPAFTPVESKQGFAGFSKATGREAFDVIKEAPGRIGQAAKFVGEKAGQALGTVVGFPVGVQLGFATSKERNPYKRFQEAIEQGKETARSTGQFGKQAVGEGFSIFPNAVQTTVDITEDSVKLAAGDETAFIDHAADRLMQQVPGIDKDQAKNYLVSGNYEGDLNKVDNTEVAKAWYASMLPVAMEMWFVSGLATSSLANTYRASPTKGWTPKRIAQIDLEKGLSKSISKGEAKFKTVTPVEGGGTINVLEAQPSFWRRMTQPISVKNKGVQIIGGEKGVAVGQRGRNLIVFGKAEPKAGVEAPTPALPGRPGAPSTAATAGDAAIFEKSFSQSLFPGGVAPGGRAPTPATPSAPVSTSKLFNIKQAQSLTSKPIDPAMLKRLSEFTPEQQSAFGRKVVQNINKTLGTEITDAAGKIIPSRTVIKNIPSGDGRPAQINQAGQVEIFMPNLAADIGKLIQGERILAHEGSDTVLFESKPGQSFDDIASEYIQEVVIHERAHQLTINAQDTAKTQKLSQEVAQARLKGSEKDVLESQTALDKHLETLEQKANSYVKANREDLTKEMFPTIKPPAKPKPTKIEKKIFKTPKEKKAAPPKTLTEAEALKKKLRTEAETAKKGFKEGVKVTRSKFQELTDKIRSRTLSLEQKRAELTKYASEFLPIRARGKRLKGIANLTTNSTKAFQEQLDLIKKEANLSERRTVLNEIDKELKSTKIKNKNKFPSPKFAFEAQKALDKIRANYKGDYAQAQIKIADLISDFQTKNPDASFPADLLRKVQLLKMVGVKDMTSKELRSMLAEIKNIKETGRTKLELEKFNRDAEVEIAREKVVDVVTGGQPLPSEKKSFKNVELPKSKRRELFEGIKSFATTSQFGLEDILDSLSAFDKGSKPFNSFLSRYVHRQVTDSFNQQNAGEVIEIKKVHDEMMKIYGLTKNKELISLMQELTTPVDLGFVKHADGKARKLTISRDQAIKKWMELQDETLANSFEIGLNWNEAVIKKMESIMTKEDLEFAKWQLEFYADYYEGINDVFKKEYGVDLPFSENYSPISRDVEVTIPENVLLAQEAGQYASAKNASLKGRVKNNIELKPVGSIETMMRHIAKMEHYKAWSEPLHNFRRVFGDKEVRQAIIDFHGKRYLKVTDNFLNDFARDGVAREKIVTIIDKIRSNTTKALLGLNKNVGMKQLVGLLNYGIELPTKDFIGGVTNFWKAPIQKARFLFENSPVLQERFGEGFERDIKFAIKRNVGRQISQTRNLSELLFIFIRNADKLTVYHGAWAAYRSKFNEMKREGTHTQEEMRKESIRHAENITNRIQETSRIETLSEIQRGGSLAKMFTMFQSQPNKYYRVILNAMRNYRAGRGSKTENLKRILWAWFIVPFVYNMFAEQFVAEEYRSSKEQIALKTLLGPLSYPLVTGQLFQSAYGWATGEPFRYQASAVFAFMDDLQKAFSKLDVGDIEQATTYMADTIGKLTGVPTTVFTKPLRKELKKKGSGSKKKGGAKASF